MRAPLVYGGVVCELIRLGKFANAPTVWCVLGHLIAADPVARQSMPLGATIVGMPLGKQRARARGYNQSTILARVLGQQWQLPVGYCLRRSRETAVQSTLPMGLRLGNVQGAFFCPRPICGPVVLIDDVVTSGATLRQAAMALRQAGASSVCALAVARTPQF